MHSEAIIENRVNKDITGTRAKTILGFWYLLDNRLG